MMKSGSHNFLEPSGPVQTCTGVGFTDSLVMPDIIKNPPLSGVLCEEITIYQKKLNNEYSIRM